MAVALVTGGAGFIGSHLARRLLSEGWRVLVVDNLSTGFRSNVPPEAEFIFLDLAREDFVEQLPSHTVDVVFHLAAQSSGEISFDDPVYDFKTNCLSTLLLLDWCHRQQIRRFIYTSSMSVYGDQEIQPVGEAATPRPKSFYGNGKLASEGYLGIYAELGLDTTALRLFNVYGPGQNLANMRQGMVSIYLAYILRREEVLVKGSPDRYRDFVYIDDVVEAYLRCLDDSRSFGRIYNVASGTRTSVGQLLKAELKAFGQDPARYPVRFSGSTPGDTFGIYADITAVKTDLGWEPKTSLESGLEMMARWALFQQ